MIGVHFMQVRKELITKGRRKLVASRVTGLRGTLLFEFEIPHS